MLYFSVPMQDYDQDVFSVPISAGTLSLFCRFSWPTEIQKQYDDEIAAMSKQLQSVAFFLLSDPRNTFHFGLPFNPVDAYQRFVDAWEIQDKDVINQILNEAPWALDLKDAVMQTKADTTYDGLYIALKEFIVAIKPTLDYIESLTDDLVWSLTIDHNAERRVECINPNIWLFHGHTDFRISFITSQERITRNNLGQTTMYIAVGEGDV